VFKYAELGIDQAFHDLGLVKIAIEPARAIDRTIQGIYHRQAAQGLPTIPEADLRKKLTQGMEGATTPFARRKVIQDLAAAQGVAGRPSPLGGTRAAVSPPKPRPASPGWFERRRINRVGVNINAPRPPGASKGFLGGKGMGFGKGLLWGAGLAGLGMAATTPRAQPQPQFQRPQQYPY